MNTSKQINIMVVLVFIAVLATGAYTLWDPHRASDARAGQLEKTVDRGAFLFSQNCRVCHGDSGEGGLKSNRLSAAPALNREDLHPSDPIAKTTAFKRVYYTITCGRIGAAMPTWGSSQGGPLNDEQIKQLATMITEGTGWDTARDFGINGDPEFNVRGDNSDHLSLAQPLDASSTTIFLNSVATPLVTPNIRLQVDDELMLVQDINTDNNSVTVKRPLGTTKAAAHQAGATVVKPPIPPDPPSITGRDTAPSCGQNPAAAAPTAGASPTPGAGATAEAGSTTLTIAASGSLWDKSTLAAVAGQPLALSVNNTDAGTAHNFHLFNGSDASGDTVATTDPEAGPVTQTLNFGPLTPGDYFYHCDIHPDTMTGTLTAK